MLQSYKDKPAENWHSKDAAIYLVVSCVSKGQTQKHGVTQSSRLVSLPEFTQEHIFPELLRPNGNFNLFISSYLFLSHHLQRLTSNTTKV